MPKAKGKKCRQTGKKKARVEDNTDDVQGSSSSSAAAAAAAAVPGEGSSSSSSSALPTTPGLVKIGRKKSGLLTQVHTDLGEALSNKKKDNKNGESQSTGSLSVAVACFSHVEEHAADTVVRTQGSVSEHEGAGSVLKPEVQQLLFSKTGQNFYETSSVDDRKHHAGFGTKSITPQNRGNCENMNMQTIGGRFRAGSARLPQPRIGVLRLWRLLMLVAIFITVVKGNSTNCTITNGSMASAVPCTCGEAECTESTGSICYSTVGRGSCRKTDPGPFGYSRVIWGSCAIVNGHTMENKRTCDEAALRMGLGNSVPVQHLSSQSHPTGCFWEADENVVSFNAASSAVACTSGFVCLCFVAPACEHTDGDKANAGPYCRCGTALCDGLTGFACQSSTSTCFPANCPISDGSSENTGKCICGEEECTQASGLLCFSTIGSGSCRQTSRGPFGYPLLETGKCTDVVGQQFIGSKILCELAASRLGLVIDHTATVESRGDIPPGCLWHSGGLTGSKERNGGGGGSDYWVWYDSVPSMYFNTNTASTGSCDDAQNDICVCISGYDCANIDGSAGNDNVCLCGSALCDDLTGLYCDAPSSTCSGGDACTNVNAASPNVKDCVCGNGAASCNSLTGRYCYATQSQCGTADTFSRLCAVRNGSSLNAAACQCGANECTQGTGLICYDEVSSCRHSNPGPFGFITSPRHSICDDVDMGSLSRGATIATITDDALCQQAVASLGLSAGTLIHGNHGPQHCQATSPSSEAGTRICLVAEPCPQSDGAIENGSPCTCGTSVCTISTGLYCMSSEDLCAFGSVCNISDGSAISEEGCICGSSACAAGQYCYAEENLCASSAICNMRNGAAINEEECMCGLSACAAGRFCYAEGNLCASGAINVCEARDGRAVNSAVNCFCGTKICTPDTGFICFSKIGGSCRKTAPGPFGHPRVVEGSCTDENRRKIIASTANCERAAVRLGLSNTMAKGLRIDTYRPNQ